MWWFLLACAPSSAPLVSGEPAELLVTQLEGGEVLRLGRDGVWREPLLMPGAVEAIEHETHLPFAPSSLVPTSDGWWIADFNSGAVVAVDWEGAFVDVVRGAGQGGGRLQEPCAMRAHDGEVAVLGNDSGNVVFVGDDPARAVLGVPQPLRRPHGFEFLADEAWIGRSATDPNAGQVQRFDLVSGDLLGEFAPWPVVEEATAVRWHGSELLVADFFLGRITRWEPWSGTFLGVLVDGLDGPIDIEVDGTGDLWVLERSGVARIGPTGDVERVVSTEGLGWTRDLVLR